MTLSVRRTRRIAACIALSSTALASAQPAPTAARPARSARRHRVADAATPDRPPRRRDADQRRRAAPQRRAEPRRAAAAPARRRDRAERRARARAPGVFLRGANAAQTLVLVDGLRIASSTAGAAALEAIPLDQIDHIEILRGPLVEPLRRRRDRRRDPGVHARRDARRHARTHRSATARTTRSMASAGVAGGSDRVRGSLEIGARRSAGFNAIVAPSNFSYDPDRDGYRDASVSAQGVLALAPDHDVSAQYSAAGSTASSTRGDAFDDRTITTLTAWQVALRDRFTPAWQSRLSAGEGEDESVSRTAFGASPFRTRQRQYAWQNEVAPRRDAGARARDDRARAARGARVHRPGIRRALARHQLAHDRLRGFGRRARACRRTCATTIRASTAAARPARSPTAGSSPSRGA